MKCFRFLVPAVTAAVVVFAGAALPVQAADYIWGPFGITDSAATFQASASPRVAFGEDRYLVVYSHAGQPVSGNPNGEIHGALVDPLRMTISDILIDAAGSNSTGPVVAYDPLTNQYLVVCEDRQAGHADRDIRAHLLDADGGLLASGLVAGTGLDEYSVDVACAGNGTFSVVWCRATDASAPRDAMVLATTVTYNGTNLVVGSQPAILNQDAGGAHPAATCPRIVPGAGGLALVVWQWPFDTAGPTVDTWRHDIKGRVLNASTSPLGQVCAVATGSHNKTVPSLAYDPSADKFLVAWQDLASAGNGDVLAAFTTINGAGQIATGSALPVAALPYDDTCPQVSWDPAARVFLVLWEAQFSGSDHDVYARRVDPSGSMDVESAITDTTLTERRPAIARGGAEFLVLWESEDVGVWPCDIAGAFLMDRPPAPRVVSVAPSLLAVQNRADPFNTIVVGFNMPVQIAAGDLSVAGVTTGPRNDFLLSYDDITCQATLTWTIPLEDDAYILTVRDTVKGADGMALDGECDLYGPRLPSGDGVAGGTFRGLVYHLVADVNLDLSVDVVDLLYLVDAFGTIPGDAAFNPQSDFNGDSSVDVVDLLILVEHWGTAIPTGP